MTSTPDDLPLWHAMEAAWESTPEVPMNQEGHCYAYMLRALADAVVPYEGRWLRVHPSTRLDLLIDEAKRDERQRIRALLLAEADRAEAGE